MNQLLQDIQKAVDKKVTFSNYVYEDQFTMDSIQDFNLSMQSFGSEFDTSQDLPEDDMLESLDKVEQPFGDSMKATEFEPDLSGSFGADSDAVEHAGKQSDKEKNDFLALEAPSSLFDPNETKEDPFVETIKASKIKHFEIKSPFTYSFKDKLLGSPNTPRASTFEVPVESVVKSSEVVSGAKKDEMQLNTRLKGTLEEQEYPEESKTDQGMFALSTHFPSDTTESETSNTKNDHSQPMSTIERGSRVMDDFSALKLTQTLSIEEQFRPLREVLDDSSEGTINDHSLLNDRILDSHILDGKSSDFEDKLLENNENSLLADSLLETKLLSNDTEIQEKTPNTERLLQIESPGAFFQSRSCEMGNLTGNSTRPSWYTPKMDENGRLLDPIESTPFDRVEKTTIGVTPAGKRIIRKPLYEDCTTSSLREVAFSRQDSAEESVVESQPMKTENVIAESAEYTDHVSDENSVREEDLIDNSSPSESQERVMDRVNLISEIGKELDGTDQSIPNHSASEFDPFDWQKEIENLNPNINESFASNPSTYKSTSSPKSTVTINLPTRTTPFSINHTLRLHTTKKSTKPFTLILVNNTSKSIGYTITQTPPKYNSTTVNEQIIKCETPKGVVKPYSQSRVKMKFKGLMDGLYEGLVFVRCDGGCNCVYVFGHVGVDKTVDKNEFSSSMGSKSSASLASQSFQSFEPKLEKYDVDESFTEESKVETLTAMEKMIYLQTKSPGEALIDKTPKKVEMMPSLKATLVDLDLDELDKNLKTPRANVGESLDTKTPRAHVDFKNTLASPSLVHTKSPGEVLKRHDESKTPRSVLKPVENQLESKTPKEAPKSVNYNPKTPHQTPSNTTALLIYTETPHQKQSRSTPMLDFGHTTQPKKLYLKISNPSDQPTIVKFAVTRLFVIPSHEVMIQSRSFVYFPVVYGGGGEPSEERLLVQKKGKTTLIQLKANC